MKRYLIFGNAESVHLLKWVKELVKYFDVCIISSKRIHPEIRNFLPADRIFELEMNTRSEGGNYQIARYFFRVRGIIRRFQPHFVNAHYITSHGLLSALIGEFSPGNFHLILSAWGTDILVTPFKNRFYRFLTRYGLNRADLVTSDSEYMTGVIRQFSAVKTLTFTFGIDTLPETNTGKKDPGLFYSNRSLTPNYNVAEIIRIFSRVASNHSGARLVIANDGSLSEELKNLAIQLGLGDKIRFTGFLSQAEQESWYEKAWFYFTLPTSDSTSVSLLEALSFGCIPIVSDIPANREWVKNGGNGIIAGDPFDVGMIDRMLEQKESVFHQNRELIRHKAIFPDLFQNYVSQINEL